MAKEKSRHSNISTEQIAKLEGLGLVHAGYDKNRDREVFHRSLNPGETSNPKRIAVELVNTTKYELLIVRHDDAPPILPGSADFMKKHFRSGDIVYLPFGYEHYQVQHRDGSPFQGELLTNFGDAMHKGNKLPSRPEEIKAKVFRKKS